MRAVNLETIVPKLCEVSTRAQHDPYAMQWPDALAEDAPCMSPELISLHGTELYEQLDDVQRGHLAFWECINFFSLNINGERALIQGIAQRLYQSKFSEYLHHFLDEENKHMVYFGTFCQKYAGKIYSDRKLVFEREYEEGEEDFLFFVKVMIFEELADAYNIRMSIDKRLHPVVRSINEMHHKDEARHLVFGREMVIDLFNHHKDKWSKETRANVSTYITEYLKSTWREYYNPDIYADTGLPDPYSIAQYAWAAETAEERRNKIEAPVIAFLRRNEIV